MKLVTLRRIALSLVLLGSGSNAAAQAAAGGETPAHEEKPVDAGVLATLKAGAGAGESALAEARTLFNLEYVLFELTHVSEAEEEGAEQADEPIVAPKLRLEIHPSHLIRVLFQQSVRTKKPLKEYFDFQPALHADAGAMGPAHTFIAQGKDGAFWAVSVENEGTLAHFCKLRSAILPAVRSALFTYDEASQPFLCRLKSGVRLSDFWNEALLPESPELVESEPDQDSESTAKPDEIKSTTVVSVLPDDEKTRLFQGITAVYPSLNVLELSANSLFQENAESAPGVDAFDEPKSILDVAVAGVRTLEKPLLDYIQPKVIEDEGKPGQFPDFHGFATIDRDGDLWSVLIVAPQMNVVLSRMEPLGAHPVLRHLYQVSPKGGAIVGSLKPGVKLSDLLGKEPASPDNPAVPGQ